MYDQDPVEVDVAAIAYPTSLWQREEYWRRDTPRREHLRLVAPSGIVGAPAVRRRSEDVRKRIDAGAREARAIWSRRFVAVIGTLAMLVSLWAVSGLVTGRHSGGLNHLAGAAPTHGGFLYVVRSGDTLWSIATRLDPRGDPRPLITQLEGELHGAPLESGMNLVLP